MQRVIRLAVVLAAGVVLGLLILSTKDAGAQERNYDRFSHDTPQHKSMSCDACHTRQGKMESPRLVRFPGHNACIQCHVTQFTAQPVQMCAICHENVKTKEAPVQPFPARQNFTVTFDSTQHENHVKYPLPDGTPNTACTFCHKEEGAVETFPAHQACYVCHSPGAKSEGAKKSGCISCHPAATEPVQTLDSRKGGPLYNYRFSHALHNRRDDCASCHTITGRDALQPTALVLRKGHKSGCFVCHNDQRAFGGNNFAACTRCHGEGFKASD